MKRLVHFEAEESGRLPPPLTSNDTTMEIEHEGEVITVWRPDWLANIDSKKNAAYLKMTAKKVVEFCAVCQKSSVVVS